MASISSTCISVNFQFLTQGRPEGGAKVWHNCDPYGSIMFPKDSPIGHCSKGCNLPIVGSYSPRYLLHKNLTSKAAK